MKYNKDAKKIPHADVLQRKMKNRFMTIIVLLAAVEAFAEHSFKTTVWTSGKTNAIQMTSVPSISLSFALNTNEFRAGDSLMLSCAISNNGPKDITIESAYLDRSSCWSHVNWSWKRKPQPFVLKPASVRTVKCAYSVPDRITAEIIQARPKDYVDQIVEKMMQEQGTPLERSPPVFHFDTMLILRLYENEKLKWYLVQIKVTNIGVRKEDYRTKH